MDKPHLIQDEIEAELKQAALEAAGKSFTVEAFPTILPESAETGEAAGGRLNGQAARQRPNRTGCKADVPNRAYTQAWGLDSKRARLP